MRYVVRWKPSLKQRLAEIWLKAPDRKAVTAAADRIDQLLQMNPAAQGEGRSASTRILVVAPLAVVFEVHEEDRLVDVLSVRHVPKRPRS